MKKYGLIGRGIQNSFSKPYFEAKFSETPVDASYSNYDLASLDSLKWMFERDLAGCNVTMPYKVAVLSLLDRIDAVAEEVGAVNTIKREGTELVGYNTDVIGFEQSLLETGLGTQIQNKALVLGSGGAANAVAYALKKLDFSYVIVSRTRGDMQYDDINESVMNSVGLIINATPLGMKDDEASCPPIPYEYFSERHLAYDLIYNPEKTLFLEKASEQNASTINGHRMLVLQAEASWKIWNS